MKNKKILSQTEAKHLFFNILEKMLDYNIIDEQDYITCGKTNFHVKKDNFKFFFKNYQDGLLKLEKTIYYKQLITILPIFKNLIKNSLRSRFDILFNHYYYDDFTKDFTNLPVQIWFNVLPKYKKKYKNIYPRLIIQNTSKDINYCSNLLVIKLTPNIEILDIFNNGNYLNTNEKQQIINWVTQHKNQILKMLYKRKYYFKELNNLRNTNIWKI